MTKVIVAVDLGRFKAYKVTKDPYDKSAKTELIESYETIDARKKLSEKMSDAAGRFRIDSGRNGTGAASGEAHNLALETEKRLIKQLAEDINALITREKIEKWCLAAGKNINSQIIEMLSPSVRARLEKNVASNLTKAGKSEILGYFA